MASKMKISVAIIGFFLTCALSALVESLAPTIIYIVTTLILQSTQPEIKLEHAIKKKVNGERTIEALIDAHREQLSLMKNYTIQIDKELDDVQEKVTRL
jgi:hypothetical protein